MWLWMTLLACIPGYETLRPATVVDAVGADTVIACSWSKWAGPEAPCSDRVQATSDHGEWRIPALQDGPILYLLGEAPLVQTLYVGCASGSFTGAIFARWQHMPAPEEITLPLGGVVRDSENGSPHEDMIAKAAALCGA